MSHTYLKTKLIIYQFAFKYIVELLLIGNIPHHFIGVLLILEKQIYIYHVWLKKPGMHVQLNIISFD